MKQMNSNNQWQLAARYPSLAMLLPSATFVGYVIGYLLDRWLGTTWLSVLFLFLGIAAGVLELIRELQKDVKNDDTPR